MLPWLTTRLVLVASAAMPQCRCARFQLSCRLYQPWVPPTSFLFLFSLFFCGMRLNQTARVAPVSPRAACVSSPPPPERSTTRTHHRMQIASHVQPQPRARGSSDGAPRRVYLPRPVIDVCSQPRAHHAARAVCGAWTICRVRRAIRDPSLGRAHLAWCRRD